MLKKLIILPLLSQLLLADFIGAELHLGGWMVNPSGEIKTNINNININEELGLSLNRSLQGTLKFEHPVPLIPNLMLSHTRIEHLASNEIEKTIDILGTRFDIQNRLDSSFSLKMTDATIYYEILDNWLSVDFGATVRKIDGNLDLSSTSLTYSNELELVVPMSYADVSLRIPTTDFSIQSSVNYLSYEDNIIYDMKAGARIDWSVVGVEVGYRKFYIKSEFNDLNFETAFQGFYTNLLVDF